MQQMLDIAWIIVGAIAVLSVIGLLVARRRAPQLEHVCRNCTHYDLEEGQAALLKNPVFRNVMAATTPADHSRKTLGFELVPCNYCAGRDEIDPECVLCHGTGKVEAPVKSAPSLPAKAKWTDMGACLCPELVDEDGAGTVVWGGAGLATATAPACKHWRAASGDVVQIRKKNA